MFNKFFSMLMAVLLILSLASCSSEDSGNENEPLSSQPEASAPAELEVPMAEETEAAIVFEETVIIDNENVTFKVTAIENDEIWGYTLKAFLENKTDKELMFSLSDVSVNGFMCDPFWAVSVSPGMKANEKISFSPDGFAVNGISQVTDIEFTLDVYDSNDWMADHLVSDSFNIYPMGEDAVQTYEREPKDSDIVLFEDENCVMIVTGFDPDNLWGYTMNVYLRNKTDKSLMFTIDGAAINGFMADPFWAETVAAGKQSNTSIIWSDSSLEENGITDVESLTLPIRVYDANDWMAEDLISESFTITP